MTEHEPTRKSADPRTVAIAGLMTVAWYAVPDVVRPRWARALAKTAVGTAGVVLTLTSTAEGIEAREGVRMERVSGIVHKPQPAATLATLKARLEALDPFTLAALEVLTSLSASLTVGLSALEPEADPDVLWRAAELEEAWQVELWGSDWEAEERRKRRKADFLRAVEFARASDSGD